jgi:hypothetical protein
MKRALNNSGGRRRDRTSTSQSGSVEKSFNAAKPTKSDPPTIEIQFVIGEQSAS